MIRFDFCVSGNCCSYTDCSYMIYKLNVRKYLLPFMQPSRGLVHWTAIIRFFTKKKTKSENKEEGARKWVNYFFIHSSTRFFHWCFSYQNFFFLIWVNCSASMRKMITIMKLLLYWTNLSQILKLEWMITMMMVNNCVIIMYPKQWFFSYFFLYSIRLLCRRQCWVNDGVSRRLCWRGFW
jgi:hypothetical protein